MELSPEDKVWIESVMGDVPNAKITIRQRHFVTRLYDLVIHNPDGSVETCENLSAVSANRMASVHRMLGAKVDKIESTTVVQQNRRMRVLSFGPQVTDMHIRQPEAIPVSRPKEVQFTFPWEIVDVIDLPTNKVVKPEDAWLNLNSNKKKIAEVAAKIRGQEKLRKYQTRHNPEYNDNRPEYEARDSQTGATIFGTNIPEEFVAWIRSHDLSKITLWMPEHIVELIKERHG